MTVGKTFLSMVLAVVVLGVAWVPVAYAAQRGEENCAGPWLGAVEVGGETATLLVVIPPTMDAAATTVAVLDAEDGPAVAEVKSVYMEEPGLVNLVLDGEAFGADGEITVALRKPKGELLGSTKDADGEAVTPLFTVSRIAPELTEHLMKAAGLEGGVPQGIMEALETMKVGFETKSIDKIMVCVSEDFTHYQWPNKAAYRSFIEGAMMQGELDNAEFDMQYAEFTKNEDGTWTIYPIEVMAMFGSATAEVTLKQEEDAWRIVDMEVQGI